MAEDAIRGYLQLAIEKGETIPIEKKPSEKVMLSVHLPSPAMA
jgi:predicted RNase H-like HicB family nuclease